MRALYFIALLTLSLTARVYAETCSDYSDLLNSELKFQFIQDGDDGSSKEEMSKDLKIEKSLEDKVAEHLKVDQITYSVKSMKQAEGEKFLKSLKANEVNAPSFYNILESYVGQKDTDREFIIFGASSKFYTKNGEIMKTEDGFVNQMDIESPDRAVALLLKVSDNDLSDGCDIVWLYPNGNKDVYRIKKVPGENTFEMYGQFGRNLPPMMKIVSSVKEQPRWAQRYISTTQDVKKVHFKFHNNNEAKGTEL